MQEGLFRAKSEELRPKRDDCDWSDVIPAHARIQADEKHIGSRFRHAPE